MARHSILAPLVTAIVGLAQSVVAAESRPEQNGFETMVAPLLRAHCVRCHGPRKAKGDLTLHDLGGVVTAPKDIERWKKVLKKL